MVSLALSTQNVECCEDGLEVKDISSMFSKISQKEAGSRRPDESTERKLSRLVADKMLSNSRCSSS